MKDAEVEAQRKAFAAFRNEFGLFEPGCASGNAAGLLERLAEDVDAEIAQDEDHIDAMRSLYGTYHSFPLERKKIVCINFHGRGYGCNPKYIAAELLSRRKDLDIVWMTRGRAELPEGIRTVPYDSRQAIWEIATAGVIIDNTMMFTGFKKRQGQYYINTWHGAIPLKKIGYDNPANDNNAAYEKRVGANFPDIDLMLSNSSFASEMFRRTFRYGGEILEQGYPRNDILADTPEGLKWDVRSRLGLGNGKKIILYAPTYRSDHSLDTFTLDYQAVLDAMGKDWVMLIRLHPRMRSQAKTLAYSDRIINASEYPDMQELMAASDIMVTDYSNIMFEFALTGRPVFLFAPDVEDYRKERDYYFEIYDLPFPVSCTTKKLISDMRGLDLAGYKTMLDSFFEKVGLHETGHAAEYAADRIERVITNE